MKKQIRSLLAISLLSFFVTVIYGQSDSTLSAPWVSDKGYWTLESNIHTPKNHIIHFYTNDNKLVYTEHLQGVTINLNKQRTKMRLKNALETTLLKLSNHKEPEADKAYVVTMLK